MSYEISLSDIFAILGPVIAFIVGRLWRDRSEKYQRKLDLFRILMRTKAKGVRLSPEHVGALNLIEVDFYGEARVLGALERYLKHLHDAVLLQQNPEKWELQTDYMYIELVSEMAKCLKYDMEQIKLLTGGYAPRAWKDEEQRAIDVKESLLAVLRGAQPIKIVDAGRDPSTEGLPAGFPPRPN